MASTRGRINGGRGRAALRTWAKANVTDREAIAAAAQYLAPQLNETLELRPFVDETTMTT